MSIRRVFAAIAVCTGMIGVTYSDVSAQGAPLFAVLLGGNEVNSMADANAGDTNAFGSATVIFRGTNTLCWAILVTGLDTPTAAHIHGARAGINGGIRVTLAPPKNAAGDEAGDPGTVSGCVTIAGTTFAATINAIKANPSLFYVNVHSLQFPSGGVRGQLY